MLFRSLGPDGEKMSKSRGNVVNPDDVIKIYGADTTRLYMMFLGPHGAQVSWNDKGIVGTRRFLERVWAMKEFISRVSIASQSLGFSIQKLLSPPFDFPKYKGEPHLKACLIGK